MKTETLFLRSANRLAVGTLAISLLFLSGNSARADIVDPAAHVEQEVNWTIGDMAAHPTSDHVYIINETGHEIYALNTATGVIDASAVVEGNTEGGFIDFSIDGTRVHVSCPLAARIHTFHVGTLASVEARTVGVAAGSFTIGSDGFLYAVAADGYLAKVNLANGVKVDSHASPMPKFPVGKNVIQRSPDGTRLFVLETDTTSGSGRVTEFAIQAATMPSLVGTRFSVAARVKDLSVDVGGNRLYRVGGSGLTGVDFWNLSAGTGGNIPPGDTWPYMAVDQRPASPVFWAGTDNSLSGRIRRINKGTGLLEYEYQIAGAPTGFNNGRVLDRKLAVTGNGHVVYGKHSNDSNDRRYVGLIGHESLVMPQAPPPPDPPLPHTEKEVMWRIGSVLGDPVRDLIYVVNETGKKILAINTSTGAVDAEASVDANVRWGHLGLSIDNETIYLTTPLSREVHAFDAGTLGPLWSLSLQFPAQDFVIGSDGHLYAMWTSDGDYWYLQQVDLSTGFTLRSHSDPADRFEIGIPKDLIQRTGFIERSGDGNRIFIYRGHSQPVTEFAVTLDSMPANAGGHIGTGKTAVEVSVDPATNTLFMAGSAPGMVVWNMTTRVEGLWGTESPRTEGVAQAPGSDDVFAVSSNGLIRQFTKTGKVRFDYPFDSAAGFVDEDIMDRTFKVSPNGHMLYGKERWRGVTGIYVDGYQYYLGMIGPASIQVPAGATAPVYPSNVSASDSSSPDYVSISWNSAPGATSYTVYRGVGNQFIDIEEVGTTSALSFDDTTAVPDVSYRYRVVANNAAGCSGFSEYDSGSRLLTIPEPPGNVSATDQAHPDWVRVDWEISPQATGYNVYRNTINNTSGATRIATGVTDSSFTDTTAIPFTAYYYWVTGTNTLGESQYSATDTGQRGLLLPAPPLGVTASDNLHTDRVALNWSSAALADTYKVYRSLTTGSGDAEEIGETALLAFDDTTALHGVQYYYFVRGVNASGDGPFSGPAEPGLRKVPPPPVPGGFEASDDLFTDKILVSWANVGADLYFLYRGLDPMVQGDELTATTGTSYVDLSVSEGLFYYYSIRAWTSDGGFSALSEVNAGRRTIPGPAWITATDGFWEDRVELEWEAADGLHSYEVYRGLSDDPAQAVSIGTALTNALIDANAVPGQTYYYFVRSRRTEFQSDLVSPFSLHDTGYRATGAPFLPDVLIGRGPTALIGDNVFSQFGVRQEIRQLSKKLKPLRWHVHLVNDGQLEDTVIGQGGRGNRFFKVSYLQSDSEGPYSNATGPITTGLSRITAGPGEKVRFLVVVTPSRKAKGKKKVSSFLLGFRSTNHPTKSDAGRATALTE